MMEAKTNVLVRNLPQQVSEKASRQMLKEIEGLFEHGRPRLVLDCSQVERMDKHMSHLMLCCLEEAMKHNGDVRLAAVSPAVAAAMEHIGMIRLFDLYQSADDAVRSFSFSSVHGSPHVPESVLHQADRV